MSDKTCANCKAFLIYDGEEVGSCQRHPPILIGDQCRFPPVNPLAWCLEWIGHKEIGRT